MSREVTEQQVYHWWAGFQSNWVAFNLMGVKLCMLMLRFASQQAPEMYLPWSTVASGKLWIFGPFPASQEKPSPSWGWRRAGPFPCPDVESHELFWKQWEGLSSELGRKAGGLHRIPVQLFVKGQWKAWSRTIEASSAHRILGLSAQPVIKRGVIWVMLS